MYQLLGPLLFSAAMSLTPGPASSWRWRHGNFNCADFPANPGVIRIRRIVIAVALGWPACPEAEPRSTSF